MADDDAPHDWDPDREKKQTDPEAIARSFVRAAAEEQKRIEAEDEARRPQVIGGRIGRSAPITALDLQLAVHQIWNGFLVVHVRVPVSEYGGPPPYASGKTEEYAPDQAAVHAILLRALREFFAALPAPETSSGAPGSNQP